MTTKYKRIPNKPNYLKKQRYITFTLEYRYNQALSRILEKTDSSLTAFCKSASIKAIEKMTKVEMPENEVAYSTLYNHWILQGLRNNRWGYQPKHELAVAMADLYGLSELLQAITHYSIIIHRSDLYCLAEIMMFEHWLLSDIRPYLGDSPSCFRKYARPEALEDNNIWNKVADLIPEDIPK